MKAKYILTFLALSMFSSFASAACNKQSAGGIWHLFISSTGGFQNGWQTCKVGINRKGEFLEYSACISNNGDETSITNGKFDVVKECSFTGQFDVGANTYVVTDGQISRNKFDMSGVGTIGESTTELFTFDAIKQ